MEKIKESIVEGLDNLIKGELLADKMISVEFLIPCNTTTLKKVAKKNSSLKPRIKPPKSNLILKLSQAFCTVKSTLINYLLKYFGVEFHDGLHFSTQVTFVEIKRCFVALCHKRTLLRCYGYH